MIKEVILITFGYKYKSFTIRTVMTSIMFEELSVYSKFVTTEFHLGFSISDSFSGKVHI